MSSINIGPIGAANHASTGSSGQGPMIGGDVAAPAVEDFIVAL